MKMNRATITRTIPGHLKSEESRLSTTASAWSAIPARVSSQVQVPSDFTHFANPHVTRITRCPKAVNHQVYFARSAV